jgi:hypothetical protein
MSDKPELNPEKQEHGAQVVLTGAARAAARGGLADSQPANVDAKRKLEISGEVADGFSADGTSVTGKRQADDLLAEKTDNPAGDPNNVQVAEGNVAVGAAGEQGTPVTPTPDQVSTTNNPGG